MFYLLEDNRIIDSEKTRWFDLYTRVGFLVEIDGETVIRNLGKIKKQSDNVFDLIEAGDLVAQKKMFGCEEIDNISLVCGKDDKLIKCFYCAIFEDKVYAIYKPNSKGDYIKVWEKKITR